MEVPNIPHLPASGVHHVTFVPSDLYIERSDYREVRLLPISHFEIVYLVVSV